MRTLLRFDITVGNIGTAAMSLGYPSGGDFVYDVCHMHYHYGGFITYELLRNNTLVLVGSKRAFCLLDFETYTGYNGLGARPRTPLFTCANQGISVGWADTYVSNFAWIT